MVTASSSSSSKPPNKPTSSRKTKNASKKAKPRKRKAKKVRWARDPKRAKRNKERRKKGEGKKHRDRVRRIKGLIAGRISQYTSQEETEVSDDDSTMSIQPQKTVDDEVVRYLRRNPKKNIKALLDLGNDVDLQDAEGWTILHYVVQLGEAKVVRTLLHGGARDEVLEKADTTAPPIVLAAKKQHGPVFRILLQWGSWYQIETVVNSGLTNWNRDHLSQKHNRNLCFAIYAELEGRSFCLINLYLTAYSTCSRKCHW